MIGKRVLFFCVCGQIALAGRVQAAQGCDVSTNIVPPKVIRRESVYYPVRAQRNRLEGEVELELVVSAQGVPKDVRIIKSSGSGLLDLAAEYCVLQWRFKPAQDGNKKVDYTCRQSISFKAPSEADLEKIDKKAAARMERKIREEAHILPVYPGEAMRSGKQGSTEVLVYFEPNGSVTNVCLAKSSGRVDLDFVSLVSAYHLPDLSRSDPHRAHLSFTNVFSQTYTYKLWGR